MTDSSAVTPETQDSTPVKLIVFDMGHVFVDFDWNAVCQGFATRANIEPAQFKEVLAYMGSLGYEAGAITTDEFLSELNNKLRSDITREEFDVLWTHGFHENPEMAALLNELRQSRPLYLLSNTNEVHYDFLQTTFDVARHFEELILSYQVGCTKPNERIYDEVFKRSGYTPQECVFIDDLVPNIRSAQALGMKTVHFIGIADLKAKLSEFGII